MKHTITVLQDDIDNGQRKSVHYCAVARAARRDLGYSNVTSGPATGLRLGNGGTLCLEGRLPAEALDFMQAFDDGCPVEPFKFEVELREAELGAC